MSSSPRPRVAIVGAGITGLAQADVLQRCGFEVVIFERSARLGGVWANAYPEVNLQNTWQQYHLTAFPWPTQPDLHPTGAQVLAYLNAAVAALHLDVRTDHEVVALRREGEGWRVRTRHAGAEVDANFDHVIVAIGQYTENKLRPTLPGEADFRGRVLTEREVDDLSVFDGKRVVVVGYGKSAMDMATLAARRGAVVHHVFRSPRWVLPRTLFGVHFTYFLFNRFGTVMMPSWAHPTAPERFLHRRLGFLVNGFWSGLSAVLRGLATRVASGPEERTRVELALPTHPLVPDLRSATALAQASWFPDIAAGNILPHRGEIATLLPEGVRLGDGTEIPADLVMLSVGSGPPRFPFLSDEDRALLEGEPDGPQLYRHLVHPRIPGLAFGGYNHSFLHVPCAEVSALWLAALWRGELELPSAAQMEADIAAVLAWKRAHVQFEPSRSVAVSTRFQQYLDILLLDLGLSPYRKLPNVPAEIFGRYEVADYAGVVEEYLAKKRSGVLRPQAVAT